MDSEQRRAGAAYSFQSHTVFVYVGGSPDNVARYDPDDDTFDPFGIALAADGTAWVTSTNSRNPQIVHLQLDSANNVITAIGEPIPVGAQNKGVVVDTGGNVWFAAASDDPEKDCIHFFGPDGTRKTFQGGGMHGPWGITPGRRRQPVGRKLRLDAPRKRARRAGDPTRLRGVVESRPAADPSTG